MKPCHFCGTQVNYSAWQDASGIRTIMVLDCPVCGRIGVTDNALDDTAGEKFAEERAKIAAVLAERNLFFRDGKTSVPVITDDDKPPPEDFKAPILRWGDLLSAFPANMAERLERATANLARLSKTPGKSLELDVNRWNSLMFAEAKGARTLLMNQLRQDGVLQKEGGGEVLTPKGWTLFAAYEAARGNRASKIGFVAMWFDASMDKTYDEGLRVGIERSRVFTARRVDSVQFNGRIDDQIVAEIRRCRFVVADFTGHRPSVYWEAGFAHGLGIPVIYTCKEDHFTHDKTAFDTRQYAHIAWKDHAGLAEALDQRIRATIL